MDSTTKEIPLQDVLKALTGGDTKHDAISAKRCLLPPIGCGKPLVDFTDSDSQREYIITGLCQTCQDRMAAIDAEEQAQAEADNAAQAERDAGLSAEQAARDQDARDADDDASFDAQMEMEAADAEAEADLSHND